MQTNRDTGTRGRGHEMESSQAVWYARALLTFTVVGNGMEGEGVVYDLLQARRKQLTLLEEHE